MSNLPPTTPYPIGTPGTPWGDAERSTWLARQQVKRSYDDEVVGPLKARVPDAAELRRVYQEQLTKAEGLWRKQG